MPHPVPLFIGLAIWTVTISLGIYSTIRVNIPPNITFPDQIYQTLAPGFLKSNGRGEPTISAATIVLPTDVYGVLDRFHGGTGDNGTLNPGFVKTAGGNSTFTSTALVNMTNETEGVLGRANGGTGVGDTLSAGFVKIGAANTSFISTALVNMTNETTGVLGRANGGTSNAGPYTSGQFLIGNGVTGGLNAATLTAGIATLITNGAGTVAVAWRPKMYHFQYEVNSGVNGGIATSSSVDLLLNTERLSPGTASVLNVADGSFILGSGTYAIYARSTAYNATANFNARLLLASQGGGTLVVGMTEYGLAGTSIHPFFSTIATFGSSATVFRMDISNFGSTTDLGKPNSFVSVHEIYTQVFITQIG